MQCYTAPGILFETEAEMKAHYRSDWHAYNLKRKVAGLPPLGLAAFEERTGGANGSANTAASNLAGSISSLGGPPGTEMSRGTARRLKREARQAEKAAKAANNANSKSAHYNATKEMSELEYIEHKMATAADFDECSDLFSTHYAKSMEDNLAHMARTHGFYIPYMDYVTDLRGLLTYLLEMVYVGNVAIVSGKQFHSLEAVQAHMRAVPGACKMELEGHEEEYAPYYDMEALAEKSPLWEWVEEEESEDDEDGWEDDDGDGEEVVPMEEGGGAVGGGEEEDDDPLSALFEKCVRLNLLSEGQVDQLTDAVASGEATEEKLFDEWSQKLESAQKQQAAAAKQGAGEADDASMASSRRMVLRVRYRPIASGPSDEAGTLAFNRSSASGNQRTTVEVGHRSMRTYYKQSYKPENGSVSPQLHALMIQYAKAGVLAAPPGGGALVAGRKHQAPLSSAEAKAQRQQVHREKRAHLAQGLNNNMTMSGMKHFKNQSLQF